MDAIGRKRWAIAEGHIPSQSSFTDRALISHKPTALSKVQLKQYVGIRSEVIIQAWAINGLPVK